MDLMTTKMIQQDKTIKRLERRFEQMHQDNQVMFRNYASSIHNLEIQMGQLTNSLFIRNQGTLPSNIENNPMEYVKVITLRSGTELQLPKQMVNTQVENQKKDKKEEEDKENIIDEAEKLEEKEQKNEVKPYEPLAPFP